MMRMGNLTGEPEGIPEAPRLAKRPSGPMVHQGAPAPQPPGLEPAESAGDLMGKVGRCHWCGRIHPQMICPCISRVGFHENGMMAEVELVDRQEACKPFVFDSVGDIFEAAKEYEATHGDAEPTG